MLLLLLLLASATSCATSRSVFATCTVLGETLGASVAFCTPVRGR